MLKVKIKKLNPEMKMPSYAHPGDAGLDVYAVEEKTVQPGEHAWFYNGFALELPHGYAAIVKDKSSISKVGLHAIGGVFDAGFRGEYNVHLINLSNEPYTIEKGDKVGQIVIFPVAEAVLEEVTELSESSRGVGRFGSTGRK